MAKYKYLYNVCASYRHHSGDAPTESDIYGIT